MREICIPTRHQKASNRETPESILGGLCGPDDLEAEMLVRCDLTESQSYLPRNISVVFLHTKRAQATSRPVFLNKVCACSTKDILIIQGNQQSALQGKT